MASKRNLEEVEFIDSPSVPSNLNEAPFTVPETMFQYIGRVLEKPTSMSIFKCILCTKSESSAKTINCSNISRLNLKRHIEVTREVILSKHSDYLPSPSQTLIVRIFL
jgi:hypothetical protein